MGIPSAQRRRNLNCGCLCERKSAKLVLFIGLISRRRGVGLHYGTVQKWVELRSCGLDQAHCKRPRRDVRFGIDVPAGVPELPAAARKSRPSVLATHLLRTPVV